MWYLKEKVSNYRDRKRSRQNKSGTRAGVMGERCRE